jgi:hypothetical protein
MECAHACSYIYIYIYICPFESDCFYVAEANILSICGIVVPPCVHKQCGGTTVPNVANNTGGVRF